LLALVVNAALNLAWILKWQGLGAAGGCGGSHDTLSAQVGFANGSTAQFLYTAAGDHAFPKEIGRVYAGGVVIVCGNFQKLTT